MVGATGFEPATSCSRSRRATKLRYAPPTVFDSRARVPDCSLLPRVLSHELDEHARGMLTRAHLAVNLLDELEHLPGHIPDRHHQAPSLEELLEQRRGNARSARRDQDALERRLIGPTEGAVRGSH